MSQYNDYYVYLHLDCNGTVFYVGKGRKDRAYAVSGRSGAWNEAARYGFTVKFHSENLTNTKAIEVENSLITNPDSSWSLCNIQPANEVHILDKEYISQFVYYDETSPTCLRWKCWNKQRGKHRRDAGDVAGYLNSTEQLKRYKVSIKGRELMVHRVVCVLHGYDLPRNMVVNHIDCNPLNNKIDNLEVVTQKENSRKSKIHLTGQNSKSESGIVGVFINNKDYADGRKRNEVSAYWEDENGDRRYKVFNIDKYGLEEAIRLAAEYRQMMFEKINSILGINK